MRVGVRAKNASVSGFACRPGHVSVYALLCCKTCAACPVFARAVGLSCGQQIQATRKPGRSAHAESTQGSSLNFNWHQLVLCKAQLGVPLLGILIFFLLFLAKPALKSPKPALKWAKPALERRNRHLSAENKDQKDKTALKCRNRHLTGSR